MYVSGEVDIEILGARAAAQAFEFRGMASFAEGSRVGWHKTFF
jgi:hypothetical protein